VCEVRDSILPEFPLQSPECGVVSLADQGCAVERVRGSRKTSLRDLIST
jgi:hypothetical protein